MGKSLWIMIVSILWLVVMTIAAIAGRYELAALCWICVLLGDLVILIKEKQK